MDLSGSNRFDILEVYTQYCDITSGAYFCGREGYNLDDESQKAKFSREALTQLLKLVESRLPIRISIFDEVFKLMSRLDLMVDFYEFSRFYDFVFFICRENGQKNITVSRAVTAWRIVLARRFRLLDQWCSYVEKNQRHNISEDTWRQVLAFSQCVHENLEGYDSEGAWPVLIDYFVEHMYRTKGSNDASNLFCSCGDSEVRPFEDPHHGLKNFPGLKRKCEDFQRDEEETADRFASSNVIMNFKRRHVCFADKCMYWGENPPGTATEVVKHKNHLEGFNSPCAVEGCLSRGFAGLLSSR